MATAPPSDRKETAHRRARRRAVRARLAAAVAAAAVAWWAHAAAAEPIASAAVAATQASTEERPLGEPSVGAPVAGGAADVVRTVASLGLVLAIIGGAWWWLRRSGVAPVARGSAFEVLARHAVGRGQHVLIARFGTRVLCVQQTREGLRTLSELTDADEVAAMLATLGGGAARSTALATRERDVQASEMRTVDLRGGRAA